MLSFLLTMCLGIAQATPYVSQRVQVGGVTVAMTVTDPATGLTVPVTGAGLSVAEPFGSEPPADTKLSQLTTVVKDPTYPDEPIEVKTVRGITESLGDFYRRHDETVKFVRKKVAGQ